MQEQVAQLLPTREGHFVFESGHHGQVWLDLQLLLLHPERVQPLAEALADRLRGYQAAAVCGPLVEGAFVGLMVASSRRLPFSYSEPVRDHRAPGLFPVSYPIPKSLEARLCQRPPYIEPPGSGKLSHPGSPILSQAGSPILSQGRPSRAIP